MPCPETWDVMKPDIIIRRERLGDEPQIFMVNELAFGQPAEAMLVNRLRDNGGVTLSLVAEFEGYIVGHILFSPVTIDTQKGDVSVVGLAPLAVLPEFQKKGIGAMLIREGLAILKRAGHHAVVVLGHPGYYPKFGFMRSTLFGIRWEHEAPDEAFMALELKSGALSFGQGVVRFRPEFDAV